MMIEKQNNTSSSEFITSHESLISENFAELEIISRNGFNVIARAKRHGRWWCLKALNEKYKDSQTYQNLLKKEFEILISIQHPNVVSCFGISLVNELGLCLIMEWVDGITLKDWLYEPHSKQEKLRIISQLLDCIKYIHSTQTVHRDLKPSNIMITRNGANVKLIDFGLSDTDDYVVYKQPAGTTGYIAPEQLTQSMGDIRNDIYSLGCIIDEMNLGGRYKRIIAKCKASADKRYQNIAQLQKSINGIGKYNLLYSVIALLTIITSIIILSNHHNRALTTKLQEKQDSLMLLISDNSNLRQEIDTLTIKFENASNKLKATDERAQMIDNIINDGMWRMSALEPKKWREASSCSQLQEQYLDLGTKLMETITDYINNLNSLTLTEKESVRTVLYTHYSNIMLPIYNKMEELKKFEQSEALKNSE